MSMVNVKKSSFLTTARVTRIGILSAIAIMMSLTPLGYIPLPAMKITFMHVPVIIAAMVDGAPGGIVVGFIFGLSSLFINLSGPMAPVFINPLVSIFPRVMIGVVSYFVYKRTKNVPLTAALGTLTNTVGVLSMIYVFAAQTFANIKKEAVSSIGKILIGIGITNGPLEIIAAVIISVGVMKALRKFIR
ncbi:ECF transporter S component [Fonticella tunisiensis]|uniref:Putative membrane protein n=1 Tax=Fonticella tunisiensis TaxID=1096341 RepID=A0A4R7K8K2_9CLOT|nr:ECF transporter S component [Fonticella tunisiensis]TDT50318.1 putative membrane protein [Fonticella tunisiensis]